MHDVTRNGGEFVLQPNVISRAMYSFSVPARRLMAMAMSALPPGTDDYDVRFSISEFEESLGIQHGGTQRKELIAAVKECMKSSITILAPKADNPEIDEWQEFTWFSYARFEVPHTSKSAKPALPEKGGKKTAKKQSTELSDYITMKFNSDLGAIIKQFKMTYAKLSLTDFGALDSGYAIRYFEIAMSYSSLAGKGGNKPNEWWFPPNGYTLNELRELFMISPEKYKLNTDFRRKVIDDPIAKINDSNIGLHIEPEFTIGHRRQITNVRFNCSYAQRDTPRNVTPKATEKEIAAAVAAQLKELYPEEWQAAYTNEAENGDFHNCGDSMIDPLCQDAANKALRAAHPADAKRLEQKLKRKTAARKKPKAKPKA
jgi:hypothetical protein